MTLEEAIELANSGNVDAMRQLGFYYFQDENGKIRDVDESIKYFEMGAEKGDPICIKCSVSMLSMRLRAMRHIGAASVVDSVLSDIDKAEKYNNIVRTIDQESYKKSKVSLDGERGIALCLGASSSSQESQQLKTAIRLMKGVINDTIDPEVYMYLAFAIEYLSDIEDVSDSDSQLELQLLTDCINNHPNLEHIGVACAYLAGLYTYGRGTSVNYDKAVYYYQLGTEKGFDCSEMLSYFKKNIFGKWQLKK